MNEITPILNSVPCATNFLCLLQEKQFWRRYIYLWINYALWEELTAEDEERTRQVYRACLQLLPHRIFTFTKLWLLYAHFEIRFKNLTAARKTLVSGKLSLPVTLNFNANIRHMKMLCCYHREWLLECAPRTNSLEVTLI